MRWYGNCDGRFIISIFCCKSYRFPCANVKRLCKPLPPKNLRSGAVSGTAREAPHAGTARAGTASGNFVVIKRNFRLEMLFCL